MRVVIKAGLTHDPFFNQRVLDPDGELFDEGLKVIDHLTQCLNGADSTNAKEALQTLLTDIRDKLNAIAEKGAVAVIDEYAESRRTRR